MNTKRLASTTFAFLALLVTAGAASAQIDDHYKCYKIKDTHKFKATVQMIDSVLGNSAPGCAVKVKGSLYCVPATKEIVSSEMPTSPFPGPEMLNDRICYKIKCSETIAATPTVQDQFGFHSLSKLKRNMICTPAAPVASPTCPTNVDFTGTVTSTDAPIELGWTGFGHVSDLSGGYPLPLNAACGAATPPCGSCTLTGGFVAGQTGFCENNRAIACTAFNAPDAACGGNTCLFFSSAPQPINWGGVSLCVDQRLQSAPSGTFDVETGAGALNLNLRSRVHLGIAQTQGCPTCNGDPVANDGSAGGTCSGGPRNGLACDTHGTGSVFGSTSLNCPADPLANISGAGLIRTLTLSTGTSSLAAADACDAPLGALNCPCGACSGDPSVACQIDADCLGIGTCNSSAGASRQPNSCSDVAFTCDDQGDGTGRCATGPDDTWCDGFVRDDGSGIISCSVDADCIGVCPGGCGTCTLVERRRCFLEPIVAQGHADPGTPILADALCVAPTTSGALNSVLGLPGPERVRLQFAVD